MTKTTMLDSQTRFLKEFHRCCGTYRTLDIAVAWLGNPSKGEPFRSLRDIAPETRVVAGVSFFHTHPEGIHWFIDNDADIRIFKDGAVVFHPKIYLFQKPKGFALFIGSSNFTNSGFTKNQETNCLIEGTYTKAPPGNLLAARGLIESWRQDAVSFVPYRRMATALQRQIPERCQSAPETKNACPPYYRRKNIRRELDCSCRLVDLLPRGRCPIGQSRWGRRASRYPQSGIRENPDPLEASVFHDAEKRRIIGGYRPLWLVRSRRCQRRFPANLGKRHRGGTDHHRSINQRGSRATVARSMESAGAPPQLARRFGAVDECMESAPLSGASRPVLHHRLQVCAKKPLRGFPYPATQDRAG